MRVYVDSSALLKRVFAEPESPALLAALREYVGSEAGLVSSALAWVEVSRAIGAYADVDAGVDVDVDHLGGVALSGVLEKPITGEVVALARRLNPPALRSLDAIHLASALLLDVDVLIAYDRRLVEAAGAHRIRALSPR